jgi:membrane fusion protein, heavy metal efflux system
VEAGEVLFQIVNLDSVHVSAIVPESEFPQMGKLSGAELEIPGAEQPVRLARLVSIGRVVDPASRTFPVIYEFDNRGGRVAVNQTVHVRLFTASMEAASVVPDSAIVDDAGRPIVFVQVAGESFARRPVTLGLREGGMVQLVSGVQAGERVVTRGAPLIRLASMSSQVPAHGHVH